VEVLASLLSIVLALSVATERLVEIIKGFMPGLDQPKEDPRQESRRRSYLQIMAVIGGVITAYLSRDALPTEIPFFQHDFGLVCLGLLASGGSGFWNAILTYTAQAKELKKTAVNNAQSTSQNVR